MYRIHPRRPGGARSLVSTKRWDIGVEGLTIEETLSFWFGQLLRIMRCTECVFDGEVRVDDKAKSFCNTVYSLHS